MSDFDGSFMETTPFWASPSSPSPRMILSMLNQTDNGLNPINEIFPQANLSRDHRDSSEQRPGLRERLASRIGFNLPTLNTENIGPFAALFKNPIVPSPVALISPGFSPSILFLSPMFSNSSQIFPLHLNTNYGSPLKMVEGSHEGNAGTLILNNDLPLREGLHDIPTEESVNVSSHESQVKPIDAPLVNSFESENEFTHQPMNVNVHPQEGVYKIPMDESVSLPYHESHVEPFGAPLVASFESDVADKVNVDEESESKEEENEDHDMIAVDDLDVGSSSSNRRMFEGSNMIGAIRTTKTQRVILQMECEEDNPDDGFRWRKYGQKVVKRNPNPRSYYKCKSLGFKVKKRVERGADNNKIFVTSYDRIHEHHAPLGRGSRDNPRYRNRSDSPVLSQNQNNRTTSQLSRPLSLLSPQPIMTRYYRTGLSMLPSFPVNHQNSGFMYRNEEPMIGVIPDGTRVYNGIVEQLYANFGIRL